MITADVIGKCPSCGESGVVEVGCPTCPGFWYSIDPFDFLPLEEQVGVRNTNTGEEK